MNICFVFAGDNVISHLVKMVTDRALQGRMLFVKAYTVPNNSQRYYADNDNCKHDPRQVCSVIEPFNKSLDYYGKAPDR